MRKSLYLKLAISNVRRSREVYLPYFIATAIMAGCHFLVCCMCQSRSMANTPSGHTAQMIFMMALVLFTLFVFFFMLYINSFLTKRRQREFGLYGVLGLSRRHIGRVLRHELRMVIFGGAIAGVLLGSVLGRLLFMLLMRVLRVAEGSAFDLPPAAFVITGGLFLLVYLASAIVGLVRVGLSSPAQLLSSHGSGEKDSRLVPVIAPLGLLLLAAAYVCAWLAENPAMSLLFFLPLALVVIVATYMIFTSGSIAALRALRANKRIYYKRANFVAISGMFHRMRQNARGLATISIVATMLLVAEAFSLTLYFNQETMLDLQYPVDIVIDLRTDRGYWSEDGFANFQRLDARVGELAAECGLGTSTDGLPIKVVDAVQDGVSLRLTACGEDTIKRGAHAVFLTLPGEAYFNLTGGEDARLEFAQRLRDVFGDEFSGNFYRVQSKSAMRIENYGYTGGILFMGAFFSVVFLTMTVLLIYFKQITEGYDDKRNYDIMRKVGMSKKQIKGAINRQISMVFFLPLIMALLHISMATPMLARIVTMFAGSMSSSPPDTSHIINMTYVYAALCALAFAAVYFFVYRMTSRVYFRLVKG